MPFWSLWKDPFRTSNGLENFIKKTPNAKTSINNVSRKEIFSLCFTDFI